MKIGTILFHGSRVTQQFILFHIAKELEGFWKEVEKQK